MGGNRGSRGKSEKQGGYRQGGSPGPSEEEWGQDRVKWDSERVQGGQRRGRTAPQRVLPVLPHVAAPGDALPTTHFRAA